MSESATILNPTDKRLFFGADLGNTEWKICFSDKESLRFVTIAARDTGALMSEIKRAKEHFGLPADAPAHSVYEAGRDGFWLHRCLEAAGVDNVVVDPGSLEGPRNRRRRNKTDRLDSKALARLLIRYLHGDREVWRVVAPPSEGQEDGLRAGRELRRLKKEKSQHCSRIRALLCLHGIGQARLGGKFIERLRQLRRWDGSPLPPHVMGEIEREHERLLLTQAHMQELKQERERQLNAARAAEAAPPEETGQAPAGGKAKRKVKMRAGERLTGAERLAADKARIAAAERERGEEERGLQRKRMEKVCKLQKVAGIGIETAWDLTMEFYGRRSFRNREEVGAAAGLASVKHSSGAQDHDWGISKIGPGAVRALAIEMAWGWLRYQPQSALAQWYERRFGKNGKRSRKVGIVALARKLLILLWRYVEKDVLPPDVRLKMAAA